MKEKEEVEENEEEAGCTVYFQVVKIDTITELIS